MFLRKSITALVTASAADNLPKDEQVSAPRLNQWIQSYVGGLKGFFDTTRLILFFFVILGATLNCLALQASAVPKVPVQPGMNFMRKCEGISMKMSSSFF